MRCAFLLALSSCLLAAAGCWSMAHDGEGGNNTSGDTDSDSDVDSDSDGDTDTDVDSDSDGDSDGDTDPSACVRFVDIDAAPDGDGLSWETAFRRLQQGIDAAYDAAPCQVWVAAGVYYICDYSAATDTVQLRPGVGVYGGFAGDETEIDQRNWEANITVLDGAQAVVSTADAYVYHVVTGAEDALLDGFTVRNGKNGHFSFPTTVGAGLIMNGVNTTVRNCVFQGNEGYNYGGAIYIRNASPEIADCTFLGNSAGDKGGAIFSTGDGTPSISGCSFLENAAAMAGGGVATGQAEDDEDPNSSIQISNCLFAGNYAQEGGAVFGYPDGSGTVANCTFVDNLANYGGAVYGISPVTNCSFQENTAVHGGGGLANVSSVADSEFVDNEASLGDGGGIFAEDEHTSSADWIIVDNCAFEGNYAQDNGGGVAIIGYIAAITNSTFFDNTAEANGGLFATATTDVVNSIFWGNEPAEVTTFGFSLSYSIFEGGFSGEGNIDADPLFVDPENGDFRLQPGSPAIDAAHGDFAPELDIDGNPRVDDSDTPNTGVGDPEYADIGAYEYQP